MSQKCINMFDLTDIQIMCANQTHLSIVELNDNDLWLYVMCIIAVSLFWNG